MIKRLALKTTTSLGLLLAFSSCSDQAKLEDVKPIKHQSTRIPDTTLQTVYVYAHPGLTFTILIDNGHSAFGYYTGYQGSYYGTYDYSGSPMAGFSGPYAGPGPYAEKIKAYYEAWSHVTAAEKELIFWNPESALAIYSVAMIASNAVFNKFHNNDNAGIQEGNADAFRHAFWNAMSVVNIRNHNAAMVKQFMDAHEIDNPYNNPLSMEMDLFNNEVGRQIGLAHPNASYAELEELCFQATINGQLRRVINKAFIAPTNSAGNKIGTFPDPMPQRLKI